MTAPNSPIKATARTSNKSQNPQKPAMNKTKTLQVADRLSRIHSDMVAMTNVLKLARFAAEARRTLQRVDDLGRQNPEVASAISESVEACNEWTQWEDVLGQVLGYAVNRLERDQDKMEQTVIAMARGTDTGTSKGAEGLQ